VLGNKSMKYVFYKYRKTSTETINITLERDNYIIRKDVPADICGNCGEYYLG
jgi:YgiT-type zinc finger domain-containing protein